MSHEHLDVTLVLDSTCADWPQWATEIIERLHRIERKIDMTETNQEHLDADVSELTDAIAVEVAALKAQPAAGALDFSALDNLVAQTKAAASSASVSATGSADASAPSAPLNDDGTLTTAGGDPTVPVADGGNAAVDPETGTSDPTTVSGAPESV